MASWPPIPNTKTESAETSARSSTGPAASYYLVRGVQCLPCKMLLHLAADLVPLPSPSPTFKNLHLPPITSHSPTTITTITTATNIVASSPRSKAASTAIRWINMSPKRSIRAVKKVKREGAATEADIDAALRSGDSFEQIFQGYPELSSIASDDSDTSDYTGNRRKKPPTKPARKQAKPLAGRLTFAKASTADIPQTDAVSDIEYDSDSEFGTGASWLGSRPRNSPKSGPKDGHNSEAFVGSDKVAMRAEHIRNTLQIQVNSGAENGGSSIMVDLTPLLNGHNIGTTFAAHPSNDDASAGDDDSTLLADSSAATPSLRLQRLSDARARKEAPPKAKTGFTDLPNEIRVRIFRCAFVTEKPINFHSRKDFQRSAAFLRTCKIAHEEGRAVLYGENAFHFERSHSSRGKFFEEEWREIGFKDIRRFLETIGATNISMMRYISFDFSDASKSYGTVQEVQRRFVNDPVVWRCLELIGDNTHLSKFAFTLSGRRSLDRTDLHFLRALSGIKSQKVVNVANFIGGFKAKPELIADLKKLMVIPRDDPENVDGKKKKTPTVVMHHERILESKFYDIDSR